jgi:hypothetical protein
MEFSHKEAMKILNNISSEKEKMCKLAEYVKDMNIRLKRKKL